MSITQTLYLDKKQKESFIENGFLQLPQVLPPNELHQLRAAVDCISAMGAQFSDNAVIDASGQPFVVAVDKIVAHSNSVFAALLGSPLLLSIAESLCGADFFPVQDFIVIKTLGDHNEVKWHQDVVTKAHEKTFMIGFYLDPTDDANGALRIIPGSHQSDLSICELEKMAYQSLDMQAGGILIHNLKLAHSSGELSTFAQRRVVYFEFMSGSAIRKEAIYPDSFIDQRTRLIPNAMACFREKYPEVVPFDWQHPQKNEYCPDDDPKAFITSLYEAPKKVKAANYCFDFI